jgi:predicted ArsR family transcriptional regulator
MIVSVERDAVAAVAALSDGVRRALYDFVRSEAAPVTRERAASAVGISRKLAAFHLDKLVAVGLLATGVDATSRNRVGRAPKVYQPADQHVEVHLPPRSPGLLAEILVDAVRAESAEAAVFDAARARGNAVGARRRDQDRPGRLGAERAMTTICSLLSEHGYEPRRDNDSAVLHNCPFHPIAVTERALVCGLNHAFLTGILEGLDTAGIQAELSPGSGRCCVVLSS